MTTRKCVLTGLLAMTMGGGLARAQKTIPMPATDSSAQASPLPAAAAPKAVGADDASAQASPVAEAGGHGMGLAAKTAIPLTLAEGIDSGRIKNGQNVSAKLSAAVGRMPAGTPVSLTVVATVPAGKLNAVGEMSLQVVRVGKVDVFTDTQTFRGQPGHKDLPDSAPAIGTDAGLASGAALTFHVLPPPVAASGPPQAGGVTPGSVTGRASGAAPPEGAAGTGGGGGLTTLPAATAPANTTSTPIHGATPTSPR